MEAGTAAAQAPARPPVPRRRRRLHRLELPAILGVMSREVAVFRRMWLSTTFSSIVQPTIYLLAFGFGFGALVSEVQGMPYIDFIGTGTVATAVLFSSIFPGMFGTFVRWRFQRTYDALLAAPVDVEELVTAETLAIATKSGIFGMAPLLVSLAFGLDAQPTAVLVLFVGFLTGFGFAAAGVTLAGLVKSIDGFSYVNSAVITPLFLVAGTFFPISGLPDWAQVASQFNPLYHCVQLVRDCVFGLQPLADLGHVGALVLFALIMWRLAIWRLTKRLID